MIKRISVVLLTCSLLLLCGCQLADPNGGPEVETTSDKMVGTFITKGYLDLFDVESYVKDNIGSIQDGIIPADDPKYSERVYATPVEHGYAFPDLEGILLASFWVETDTEGYWSSVVQDDGLSDISKKYESTDTGSSIAHSANIYVPYNTGEVVFYLNPVYQTANGEVYLVSGTGISMNTTHGGEMKQTVHSAAKISDGNQTTSYAYDLEVAVHCIDVPKAVTYIQMDAQHQVLHRETYIPGQLPDELTPLKKAAYILIEEEYENDIIRSVNQPDSEPIEVFYRLENNLCIRDQTSVLWNPS